MGRSRRRLILGAFALSSVAALIALGAVAQVGDDPRNTSDEYFDAVNDAACYDHHLEDGFIPFGYRFTQAYSELPVRETVLLEVEIRHITQYTAHELQEMSVTVNTHDAPAVRIVTADMPEDIEESWDQTVDHNEAIRSGEVYIGVGAFEGHLEARVLETDPALDTLAPGELELNAAGQTKGGGRHVDMDLDRDFFQQHGVGNYTFSATWSAPDQVVPASSLFQATIEMNLWVNFTPEAKEVKFPAEDRVLKNIGDSTVAIIPIQVIEHTDEPQLLDFNIQATAFWEHQPINDADRDDGVFHRFLTMEVAAGDELVEARQFTAGPLAPTLNLYNMLTRLVGFIALFVIVAALLTGGVFGKKSRRFMNDFTGGAKKRVLWHSSMGFLIIVVATLHFALALLETRNDVSRGLLWGGLAWALLVSLGFTGYYQVRMIKKWNYRVWRHVHLWSAVAVLLFLLVHVLVEGSDLSAISDLIPGTDRLLWPRGT